MQIRPGDRLRPVPGLDRSLLVNTPEAQGVLTAGTDPTVLRRALERDWASTQVAPIQDAQVSSAVTTLIRHHVSNGFYGNRLEGMRCVKNLDQDGFLEVELAPNRVSPPAGKHNKPGHCVLCTPTLTGEVGLSWRNWIIWPNAFPYLPAEQQHVIIMPARHQGQRFSRAVLEEMVDYQRLASAEAPVTLHYNGVAGNSQHHLHWQGTRSKLPVEQALESGKLGQKPLRVDKGGNRVDTFEQTQTAGFLVRGSKTYVSKMADDIIQRLNTDPLTRGAYNLVLLTPKDGQVRLAIFPRCASNLSPTMEELGPFTYGAFESAGRLLLHMDQLPRRMAEKAESAAQRTLVGPSLFRWLNDLARAAV